MAQHELEEKVLQQVLDFEQSEIETLDETAVRLVAEYYEQCDYGVADIDSLDDPEEGRSEAYLLYYMLKLLHDDGHILYNHEVSRLKANAKRTEHEEDSEV